MDKKQQLGITREATQAVAGINIESASKSLRGFIDTVGQAQNRLSAAQKNLARMTHLESLPAALKKVRAELDKDRKARAVLTKKQKRNIALTKEEQADLQYLEKRIKRFEGIRNNQVRQSQALNKSLKAAGFNTKNLAAAKKVVNDRIEKSARLLRRETRLLKDNYDLEKRKAKFFKNLPSNDSLVQGGIAAGSLTLKHSLDNEASFTDVARWLNFGEQGVESEEAKKLRDALNQLAVTLTGADTNMVMQVADVIAKQGIEADHLVAYTSDAIKAANEWGGDPAEIALQRMFLHSEMSYEGDATGKDQLNTLSNMIHAVSDKGAEIDFLKVLNKTGSMMSEANFSQAQSLGLVGSLLGSGATEPEASDTIEQIINSLANTDLAALKRQQYDDHGQREDPFELLKMDATAVSADMQTDPIGTIEKIFTAIQALEQKQQNQVMRSLFNAQPNSVLYRLVNRPELFASNTQKAQDGSTDSIQKDYELRDNTKVAKLERLNDALNQLSVTLGDKLWPIVESILPKLTDLVVATSNWVAESGIATAAVIGLGAVGLAGKALLGLKTIAGGFKSIASDLNAVASGLGIARHSHALKRQKNATDKATRSTERHYRAMREQANTYSETPLDEEAEARRKRNRRKRQRRNNRRNASRVSANNIHRQGSNTNAQRVSQNLSTQPNISPELNTQARTGVDTENRTLRDSMDSAKVRQWVKTMKIATPISMAASAVEIVDNLADGDMKEVAKSGGGLMGGMGGAAVGAAIGSAILPGIGTLIGAGVGGFFGDSQGREWAEDLFDWFEHDEQNLDNNDAAEPVLIPKDNNTASPPALQIERDTAQWFNSYALTDQSQAIKTAQVAKKDTQAPNVTFAPVVQVTGAQTPEHTASLTLETVQQLLTQFAREHGLDSENLTQDFQHSLVT
ncbi:phage tail tape measure protein [Vibrio sagamiensis]|uniref:Uncharacterized protein n=1 Tax=Vibrio sagamiensis NBRC 104589 TaxID=1219064 RepID=A0A511QEF2_9VIBR|nr:phage tail tape measure protein [Vibrio sagamiensis]PNQ66579.1 phage tail tape measure protein [Vibrio agarivorans]GEM75678.1 hypothetical protein VSA01S_17900 [Vibrio sagamiensis NBRC 104589]